MNGLTAWVNTEVIQGPDGLLIVAVIRLLCAVMSISAARAWYLSNPMPAFIPPLLAWLALGFRTSLTSGATRTLAVVLVIGGLLQGLGVFMGTAINMPKATVYVIALNSTWALILALLNVVAVNLRKRG